MTVDHIGLALLPDVLELRLVGRVAFPLFAFLVTEGVRMTSSPRSYLLRLALFALASQVPYSLLAASVAPGSLNVGFTLAISAALLIALRRLSVAPSPLARAASVALAVAACVLASALRADYGGAGVLTALVLAGRERPAERAALLAPGFALLGPAQLAALLSVPVISLYDGSRGALPRWAGRALYAYYPAHMLVLWAISRIAP